MDIELCVEKVLQIGNQYSIKGILIDNLKNADNLNKMNNYIDTCQKELVSIRKLQTVKRFTINPIPNLLGLCGTQLIQHLDIDIVYNKAGIKAYYFEADKPFTVTINVNGVITTVTGTPTEMTAYKGFTGANSTDNVIVTFTGNYPYNIQNIGLYAYAFASTDDIPSNSAYTKVVLPDDFKELKEVRVEKYPFSYNTINDYFILDGYLMINSYISGNVAFHYYRKPKTIDKDTVSTTLLELDDDVCELIPYYVAGHIFLQNSPSISTMILDEYENKRDRLTNPQDNNIGGVSIENVWGGYNGL